MAVIETNGLTRKFKQLRAVDQLDLSVEPGELFGLVGPDGAGKTTLLRLLAGLLDISDGEATVLGFDLRRQAEAIKPLIGYMAQLFNLYTELTVLENLAFFTEIYQVRSDERAERVERLLEFAGLVEFKPRRAAQLSGGMQKKLALACTLIHQPKLLLLDEPTTGVDPVSRREFWNILTELHLTGTTIVVSTPYMDEADRCARVGLMYEGKLVICDTPQSIRARLDSELIALHAEDWRTARDILSDLPAVREVQVYGDKLHLLVDSGEARLGQVREVLNQAHIPFSDLRVSEPRMEEAFISLIKEMEA